MRYAAIPGTDMEPSVICMGGGQIAVENNEPAMFELLDTYFELGGTFFDSANVYGKWLPAGKNVTDIILGKWLKARGFGHKAIIASKGGHPPLSDMTVSRLSKAQVETDLNESLKALNRDYIDLYYLHRDDESIPVETIMDYLNEFVKEGKIRYFGASNWRALRIEAAQKYAHESGKKGFSANQLLWNLGIPDMSKVFDHTMVSMDADSRALHLKSGLAAIAYESQARGFFQKYMKKDIRPLPDNLVSVYGSKENELRAQRAVVLSGKLGVNLTAISLGYVLNQPFPSFAVVGSRTNEQLKDSMAATDFRLTPDDIEFLEKGLT